MILLTAILNIFGIVFTLISTTDTAEDLPVAEGEFTAAQHIPELQPPPPPVPKETTEVQRVQQLQVNDK